MDVINLGYNPGRNTHYRKITQMGDSLPVILPVPFRITTVMISSISNGTVKLQYSLDTLNSIISDTSNWHDWSNGDVSDDTGDSIDSPSTSVRVVADSAVQYTLEVLS